MFATGISKLTTTSTDVAPRGVERRVHPRVELLAQVQLTRDDEVHVLSTLNISRGGAFLQADPKEAAEIKVGAEVELVIFSDDLSLDLSCKAKVVRVVHWHPSGLGVQFTEVSNAGALDAIIESALARANG